MPEDVARPLARRRRADATALPAWIKPQLTKLVDEAPEGPEWLHEVKSNSTATGCMPGWTAGRPGC